MKLIVFDGWEVLLALITIIGVCVGLYNRGFRKGIEFGEQSAARIAMLEERLEEQEASQ